MTFEITFGTVIASVDSPPPPPRTNRCPKPNGNYELKNNRGRRSVIPFVSSRENFPPPSPAPRFARGRKLLTLKYCFRKKKTRGAEEHGEGKGRSERASARNTRFVAAVYSPTGRDNCYNRLTWPTGARIATVDSGTGRKSITSNSK